VKSHHRLLGASLIAVSGVCAALAGAPARADDGDGRSGALYTMSNSPSANAVLVFKRADDGALSAAGLALTGGLGTGGGLGNEGGLVLSEDGRWLVAVDAGSNDIAVFAVRKSGLTLVARAPSGGVEPISVTIDDDLIYALNAGSDSISGFRLSDDGRLTPLAGSTRPLSGTGVGGAQISFSPDGRSLVVTEKAANRIVVYPVGRDGLPAATPNVVASPGQTPFGFGFSGRRTLLVSDAAGGAPNGSAVSSYRLDRNGALSVEVGVAPTLQTAACWIVTTPDGKYAYSANTGSGSLSGFLVGAKGALTLLNANGVTASTGAGSGPTDSAISRDGRFLYVLGGANNTISAFQIGADGSLTRLAGGASGLPVGGNGMAAR